METMMDLRALTDRIIQEVEPKIRAQAPDEVLEPGVLCFKGDEIAVLPVAPMFSLGSQGRELVAQAIKSIAAELGMDIYVICAESHFLSGSASDQDEIKRAEAEGIADHPDRQECIMMTAGDRSGTLVRVWIMKRGLDGKVIALEEHALPEDVQIEGRFHDLLKEPVTVH